MDDRINARLAAAGLAVVSVDYGLLPETPFVTMVAQCHAAADYVMQHTGEFGAGPIFIGGESAGAHLAACTLLRLRERADFGRITGAVLFYGVYDLGSSPSVRSAHPATLVLHGPSMRSGIAKLLPDRDEGGLRKGDYSPLFADLRGLPPVLLICGTIDPLIDDSTQMADAMRAAGVDAQLVIVPDAPHAFNRFPTRVADRTNAHVRGWLGARMDQQASARAAG
jgi:acetyl esterase/lipase